MNLDMVFGWATGQGGVETVSTILSQTLKSAGHRVRVFQSRPPLYPEWEKTLPNLYYYDPVAVGFPPRYPGESDSFRWALGYRSLLQTMGAPDVILAAHTPALAIVTRLAVGYGPTAPMVVSWLHGPPHAYGDPSGLWLADGHLAISTAIARSIREITKQRYPVFVVGNPVPMAPATVRRPQGRTEILYVGRLENEQKNLALLAGALNALPRSGYYWHATVVGDGPHRDLFAKQVEGLVRTGRVSLRGWRTDPWDLVEEASVLVLPSNYEGFGVVLVEALSRGIPVLSTESGGPEDIVQSGANGWLVPVGDARAFSRVLTQIVEHKVPLPGIEVCRRSAEKFDPEGVASRIVQHIETIGSFRCRLPV